MGALGGGALTGKYLRGEPGRVPEHSLRRNDRSTAIAQEVVTIADEIGVAPAQVALAWTRQKSQSVVPIIGARRPEQIRDSLGVLSLVLTDEHRERLDAVSAIDIGFPHDFLVSDGVKGAIGNTQDSIISLRK